MYIISYDVASKSLALSIIYFNDNWATDLQKINDDFQKEIILMNPLDVCKCALKYIDKLELLIDTLIVPKIFDVVDLIPGEKLKDTSPILRASRLKSYLTMVDEVYLKKYFNPLSGEKYKVLLEYQMGPNDKSRSVCSQILYHYAPLDIGFKKTHIDNNQNNSCIIGNSVIYDVEIIGPSLKNKINLIKNQHHSFFIKKYAKSYDANKAHSKSNFLQWVKTKKVEYMIKNIKKKNIHDIADSATMTLAWIYIKSGLM